MNLPLLNDNLDGFSNMCGVILGPLEELLGVYFRSILVETWVDGGGPEKKYSMILCLWVEN